MKKERGVRFDFDKPLYTAPGLVDQAFSDRIYKAAEDNGIPWMRLPSGAGHDAAVIGAAGIPVGMIFIANQNGSHNPHEEMIMKDFMTVYHPPLADGSSVRLKVVAMDRSKLISVVLVDEYPLFGKAMADLLNATGQFQVLGQTGEGDTALGLSSLGPHIVVMSLEAEEYSALDLLKEIEYRQPATRVVMVMSSAHSSGQLDAGHPPGRRLPASHDYAERLRRGAQEDREGGMAVSEKVTSALAEKLRGDSYAVEEVRRVSELTSREQDGALGDVAAGISNLEISKCLGISEGTVKVHVKNRCSRSSVPLPRGARRLGVGTPASR